MALRLVHIALTGFVDLVRCINKAATLEHAAMWASAAFAPYVTRTISGSEGCSTTHEKLGDLGVAKNQSIPLQKHVDSQGGCLAHKIFCRRAAE